jgi:phospholipid/cholesterol/gamma-HCH transport system substrate-binding protein
MERFSLEVKVGLVVVGAMGMVLAFIFILGDWNPFSNTYRFTVTLDYAGGIKPGSVVQVAGAKVGKVDLIKFHSGDSKDDAVLGLELLIDKRAKSLIREDSKFAVHMESLLGGKIIEITPGSSSSAEIEEGAFVKGIDPPKLDELINEAVAMLDGIKSILDNLDPDDKERMKGLLIALSRFNGEDIDEIKRIIHNTADATEDLKVITAQVRPELKPLMDDVKSSLNELEPTLQYAKSLLRKTNKLMLELEKIMPEDKDAARQKVEELLETGDELVAIVDRLDRFTAKMETEFSDFDKDYIERVVRQFLQQEGVTINVDKVFSDPGYPAPPQ